MKKNYLVLLFIIVSAGRIAAQGCSDAGFCTIPFNHQVNPASEKKMKNSLTTEIAFGLGEGDTKILTPSLLYSRKINSHLSWDNKFTASYVSGGLGNIFGGGDWYSTLNVALKGTKKVTSSLLAGFKIPFTNANTKENGQPLPMAYQTSLGTYDFIGGAAWVLNNKFNINAAVQVPVINNNENTFVKLPGSNADFITTTNFERRPDALLRLGYLANTKNKKWLFQPNLLAIMHLGEDSYETTLGKRDNIDGSSGLTLNINLLAEYKITDTKSLNFSIATPALVRDARPDGLTRSFTFSMNYRFGF